MGTEMRQASGSLRIGYVAAACLALIPIALMLSAGSYNRTNQRPVRYLGAGVVDPSQPLGPRAKSYTLEQARNTLRANRIILPKSSLTPDGSIQGIWANDGRDWETYIAYDTGIVVTESAISIGSGAPTDVASFGEGFLGDGGGAKGLVTQIEGHDAFVAYANDPTGAEGPGSILVEVDGSQISVIGTTSAVTIRDLYDVTSAVIQAGGG